MSVFSSIRESIVNRFPGTASYYRGIVRNQDDQIEHLEESMSRLQLEMENEGYARLTQFSDHEFDRHRLEGLIKLGVAMAIKNPIVCRTVNVQADYVFGRGVKFVAIHPLIQSVVDEHSEYSENQKVLYSHDAMSRQERELQVKGNLFFALFTNKRTGRVIVRDIDMTEVQDIVRDPNDYHTEWFIKRIWTDGNNKQRVTYHPALGITKETPGVDLPSSAQEGDINWDAPVYHMSFNRYGRMKFGIPEVYPQLDWALAYKRFLEDWTSIMRAFSRMAMKVTGLGGKKQAAAARSLLQTSMSLGSPNEKNPSPSTASTALTGKGVELEPIKTAGATTDAKAGQPILNMASAAAGLPNTFYGDASQARGDTLDRPTEMKMVARQRLWMAVFGVIMKYVVFQAAVSPGGLLRDAGATLAAKVDPFTDAKYTAIEMPVNEDEAFGETGVPICMDVDIKFPELLERNVTDRVRGLVNALTLFGKPLTDIMPDKRLACKWILEAMNIENVERMIPGFVKMWEKNMSVGDDGKPVDPIIIPPAPIATSMGAEDPSQGGDVGKNG